MANTYKPIVRRYLDERYNIQYGIFICQGQFGNGKLAYSMIAKLNKNTGLFDMLNDEEIEEQQVCYIQYRDYDGMIMEHI